MARELQARSGRVSVAETFWVRTRLAARASPNRASPAQGSPGLDLQAPDSQVLVDLKIRKILPVHLRSQPSN